MNTKKIILVFLLIIGGFGSFGAFAKNQNEFSYIKPNEFSSVFQHCNINNVSLVNINKTSKDSIKPANLYSVPYDPSAIGEETLFATSKNFPFLLNNANKIKTINNKFDTDNNILKKEIKISPNPTFGEVNIISEKKILSVSILDFSGKQLIETEEKNFDISFLKPGVYFVNIQTQTGAYNQKIIKK